MIRDWVLPLARKVYGEEVARLIFEPLVADFDREMRGRRSPVRLRMQWLGAIAQTFLACAPRAFAFRMPTLLFIDVIGCAVAFPLIALMLQWREIWREDAGHFGWRLVAALSFTVIPVVWRFRVAAIPEHQGRALARSYILMISAAVLAFGYEEWPTRAAQVIGIFWLGFVGWRLGDPARQQAFTGWTAAFMKMAMVSGCLIAASWPTRLALGVEFQSLFWQQQQWLIYSMALMTVITLKKRFNGFTSIGP